MRRGVAKTLAQEATRTTDRDTAMAMAMIMTMTTNMTTSIATVNPATGRGQMEAGRENTNHRR